MKGNAKDDNEENIDDEVDYEEENDEDDDEDDFIPGVEEEQDDDDEDEEDDFGDHELLVGDLRIDEKKKLHWEGEGISLTSSTSLDWDLLNPQAKAKETMSTTRMSGSVLLLPPPSSSNSPNDENHNESSSNEKPPYRIFNLTWTMNTMEIPPSSNNDDDNDTKAGKQTCFMYYVHGEELGAKGANTTALTELQGQFVPLEGKRCVCKIRRRKSSPASPAAAAAAAAAPIAQGEDDDVEAEADEDLDYNELIALHEDAGLSVADLRKRYRNDNNGTQAAENGDAKKVKTAPVNNGDGEDDGDDDDVGF